MIHVVHKNEQSGPHAEEDIRQKLASGDFLPTDLAWKEGMEDWKPLGALFYANPSPPPTLQFQKLAQYLPHAREWCYRIGGWLKASISRPAYVVLWCCDLVFAYQSLQMGSLEQQIANLEQTSLAGDLFASVLWFFVSPEPFTPFFAFFNTLGGMLEQDATLEGLKAAYTTARFWRITAVVTAVGTLFFLWFKKPKTQPSETSA